MRNSAIADNQTASLSQWDYDLLPLELAELQKMIAALRRTLEGSLATSH